MHDLAKKLEALAERGVGGEKTNAARMLADLRAKLGISPEQIETDTRTTRSFPVFQNNPRHRAFVGQCIGSTTKCTVYFATKAGVQSLECDVTHAEYVEIEAKISFYWALWLKEEASFFSAFVQVNGLGGLAGGNGKAHTPEELAELRRKAKAIDAQTLHKQLGKTNP